METYCVSCKKKKKKKILQKIIHVLETVKLCCFWQEKRTFIKNQELPNFDII